MEPRKTGRRDFAKRAIWGAGGAALAARSVVAAEASRLEILAALGETIVPSKPGDPGFKELKQRGIVEEVNKTLRPLRDEAFTRFNEACKPLFRGRTFVELTDKERAEFLTKIIDEQGRGDKALRRVYRFTRIAVLKVFYSNFPEGKIVRDQEGLPVLQPGAGELHQVTNPNTKRVVTGWDIARYRGPLTWDQEEQMRAKAQQVHWHDPNDLEALIVRYRPKPA